MATGYVQVKSVEDKPGPGALHELLELAAGLKHFLRLAERASLGAEQWPQVLEASAKLRECLRTVTCLAEEALGGGELISSLKTVAYIAEVIRVWSAHPKRKLVLEILETYAIDERIRSLVDQALSDSSGNLVGLLNLDLRAELVVMLEVQVEQLAAQLRALEKCGTAAEKADVLRALNPLNSLSAEQLEVSALADGVLSVNDLELTVSAVAVLALLRPA